MENLLLFTSFCIKDAFLKKKTTIANKKRKMWNQPGIGIVVLLAILSRGASDSGQSKRYNFCLFFNFFVCIWTLGPCVLNLRIFKNILKFTKDFPIYMQCGALYYELK